MSMSSDLEQTQVDFTTAEEETSGTDGVVEELNYAEWSGVDVIEGSLCMECGSTGKTMMMLHKIPFFRELIIASFKCDTCHAKNNEVTFGGEIQIKGSKIELKVVEESDLNRQLIKSDSASVFIPELDFEIPPGTQKGEISTLEGILRQAATNLSLFQTERMQQQPEVGIKVAMVIMQLTRYAAGEILPFTLILDDCSGNSYIENPRAPAIDPRMKITKYTRTREQDISLGLNPDSQKANNDATQGEAYVDLFDRTFGAVHVAVPPAPPAVPAGPAKGSASYNVTETAEEIRLGRDEAILIPSPCPNCSKQGTFKTAMTSIPHFKEVLIMAFSCTFCGFKTNEVKGGGAVPEMGTQLTLTVGDWDDMKRDVLKGDSAMLQVPEIDLELSHGSLGGVYSTVEGLMSKIYTNLRDNNPFAIGDSVMKHHSDEESTSKREFVEYLQKLKDMCDGKAFPFTLVLRDPLGNSFISAPLGSFLPPEADGPLDIADYERSFEENDEYGLNDMNVADFETLGEHNTEQDREAYYNPRSIQPDILTHILPKGADHPREFAQGVKDNTQGGVVFTKWESASLSASKKTAETAEEEEEEEEEGEPVFLTPPTGFSAGKVAKGGLEDFPKSLQLHEEENEGDMWELPFGEDYSKRHFDDDSGLNNEESFEAREEFAGHRPGFVYHLGSLGLGYYLDVKKAAA